MPPKNIRVRIAPSPTGYFHIGTARTALMNYLYARKSGGVFVVRIEDTDAERSHAEYERIIFESLEWLGLTWDEGPGWVRKDGSNEPERGAFGPYRQSERRKRYAGYLEKLIASDAAYWCFCTKEDLDAERQSLAAEGLPPKYSGKCRSIPKAEAEARRKEGASAVLRVKMPEEKISFTDLVRGKVEFDMSLSGDMVVAKDLQTPLFDIANVVDDHEMQITHVIRGEDHIPNTPKQIVLRRALGLSELTYAHIPLILNADRSKMSKRSASTALGDYERSGYLPHAMVNFLALLGWHPGPAADAGSGKTKEQEIFPLSELVKLFDISRVQKGGAIFNLEKLEWINSQYIKAMPDNEILAKIQALHALPSEVSEETYLKILGLVKPRMRKLSEFTELADFFFSLGEYPAPLLIWKTTDKEAILQNLIQVRDILSKTEAYDPASLKAALLPLTESAGNGPILWPLRVALSGKEASPGPFEIMDILGKHETMRRVEIAIKKLS